MAQARQQNDASNEVHARNTSEISPEHTSPSTQLEAPSSPSVKSKEELVRELKVMLLQSNPKWLPEEPVDATNPELWIRLTDSIATGEDWRTLVTTLSELGPPVACFGISPQELVEHFKANDKWSGPQETASTLTAQQRMASLFNYLSSGRSIPGTIASWL